MSEKQIDLDAMRALAKDLSHASNWRTCDCPICSGRRLLRAAADEIEQLRKERDALREALRFYADFDCTHHRGTVARAALAAQGDKPHD